MYLGNPGPVTRLKTLMADLLGWPDQLRALGETIADLTTRQARVQAEAIRTHDPKLIRAATSLAGMIGRLKNDQENLERDLADVLPRVQAKVTPSSLALGLGFLPVAITASALAVAAAAILASLIKHSQAVRQAAQEMALIEKGLATPESIAKLRASTPPGTLTELRTLIPWLVGGAAVLGIGVLTWPMLASRVFKRA